MAETDVVAAFSRLDTPTISDALDRLGIASQVPGILPLLPGFRLCGRAHTLRYEPVDSSGGTVGDFIDDVEPDRVLVLDNGGRLDCTVWGDLLTSVAHRRGLGGTVIDGMCRDMPRSIELDYPVFSRGRWMRTGKDRVRLCEIGGSVVLNGVPVDPGDIVVGDADGVVVVPAAKGADVAAAAESIREAEAAIREAVEAGSRLDEARRSVGYHALQSRPKAL